VYKEDGDIGWIGCLRNRGGEVASFGLSVLCVEEVIYHKMSFYTIFLLHASEIVPIISEGLSNKTVLVISEIRTASVRFITSGTITVHTTLLASLRSKQVHEVDLHQAALEIYIARGSIRIVVR
jgi:hypothetical protein